MAALPLKSIWVLPAWLHGCIRRKAWRWRCWTHSSWWAVTQGSFRDAWLSRLTRGSCSCMLHHCVSRLIYSEAKTVTNLCFWQSKLWAVSVASVLYYSIANKCCNERMLTLLSAVISIAVTWNFLLSPTWWHVASWCLKAPSIYPTPNWLLWCMPVQHAVYMQCSIWYCYYLYLTVERLLVCPLNHSSLLSY